MGVCLKKEKTPVPRRLPKGLPIPKKRKIIVDFEDDNEPLEIEYSPRQAADGWQQVKEIGEDVDTETATILWLAKSITRWDYQDEQGNTFPLQLNHSKSQR